MTSELDNFLSSLDGQAKQKEKANRELWRRQNTFIAGFKECLDRIIHPVMVDILDKLRKRGYYGLVLSTRRGRSNPLPHLNGYDKPPKQTAGQLTYRHYENYYISARQLASGISMILTVLGNYSIEKVCIFTECLKTVDEQKEETGGSKTISVSKTEERYSLPEINPSLLEKLVLESFRQMLSIGK